MTKYNELDSKILTKISGHPTPFSSLYVKEALLNKSDFG